jgi:hypothetical protein
VSEDYHGQMLKNGFMDDFYSNETEQHTTNTPESNVPQGIIIAHMPDLGDCKPILNGNNETGQHASANTPTQHHSLLGSLNNFIRGTLDLTVNQSDNNTNDFPSTSTTRFSRSNIQFSRLVTVGVVVLFCGVGLVVQNQMNKNDSSKEIDNKIVAIENDTKTAKIDDKTGNELNPNKITPDKIVPKNLNTTQSANAQNKNQLPTNLQNKIDKNLNTQKEIHTANPNPNPNSQSAANNTTQPNQNTTKQSLWDRQSTDNYSPWMKSGQILLETENQEINPNTNTHSTEYQSNIITQTSSTQLQPSRISTPYPSDTNPNRQPATPFKNNPQNESYHYSTGNNYNYNNTPNTGRVAPPPYANSMSLQIPPNSFHSPPPSVGTSQGRIAAAETPATYRKFYNNPADVRVVQNGTQPPAYNYNYPTQPTRTVAPSQPPLTASAYPTNHYQNPTYQPSPTYQPTAPYQNTTYQNTSYPTTTYPNPPYPSGATYPNGVYPNPTFTPVNQPY